MDDAETSSDAPGRSPGTPVELDLVDETGTLAIETLHAHAADALAHLGCTGSLRVRIVGDDAMADAHERYAGVPGTTDVLTFDLGSERRALDADLLVCADEARRQAEAHQHEAWREALLYIVHGVLHCLGHDDHEPGAAARMHQIEDDTLEAIGVGRTYAEGPGHGETC